MSRKLKQVISCQSFSPISDVRDGIIVTKDGKFVKLMEFSPINYGLRSNEDKNMITAQYAAQSARFQALSKSKFCPIEQMSNTIFPAWWKACAMKRMKEPVN